MSSTAILLREKSKMNGKKTVEALFRIFNYLNYEYQIIDSDYNDWTENLSIEISVNCVIKSENKTFQEGMVLYVREKIFLKTIMTLIGLVKDLIMLLYLRI